MIPYCSTSCHFICRDVNGLRSFGCKKHWVYYLQKGHTINGEHAHLLMQLWNTIMTGKNWRMGSCFIKTMLQYTNGCNSCCEWLWHWIIWFLFFGFGTIWLSSVPQHKKHLSVKQYRGDENFISATDDVFMQQNQSFFPGGMHHRWKNYVDCKGDYVEKYSKFHKSILVSLLTLR